jgi:hypothetical protein
MIYLVNKINSVESCGQSKWNPWVTEKNRRYEGGNSCLLPHIPEDFSGVMKKNRAGNS